MKIAIIGAGAIGSLVAAYLADQKEEVSLVAHPQQVAAISEHGLTIKGVRGKLRVKVAVKRQLDEVFDLVILATKTQDLKKAVRENRKFLPGRPILSVQNGIRAEELIADRLGKDNLFSSIVMFGATYLAPGEIMHNFEGNWILGKLNSASTPAQTAQGPLALEEVRDVIAKIFPVSLSDDIMALKWLKLFLNANNCLPALLGKSIQQTFSNISLCKISLHIWKEAWAIVEQARIKMSSLPTFPLERISKLISLPEDEAAQLFSKIMVNLSKEPLYGSILQSIKRGRLSEIDYINGEFVTLAESLGQKEKGRLNARLVQMVHSVEKNKQFFSEEELCNQTKEFLN